MPSSTNLAIIRYLRCTHMRPSLSLPLPSFTPCTSFASYPLLHSNAHAIPLAPIWLTPPAAKSISASREVHRRPPAMEAACELACVFDIRCFWNSKSKPPPHCFVYLKRACFCLFQPNSNSSKVCQSSQLSRKFVYLLPLLNFTRLLSSWSSVSTSPFTPSAYPLR